MKIKVSDKQIVEIRNYLKNQESLKSQIERVHESTVNDPEWCFCDGVEYGIKTVLDILGVRLVTSSETSYENTDFGEIEREGYYAEIAMDKAYSRI